MPVIFPFTYFSMTVKTIKILEKETKWSEALALDDVPEWPITTDSMQYYRPEGPVHL